MTNPKKDFVSRDPFSFWDLGFGHWGLIGIWLLGHWVFHRLERETWPI
jgi:hypothetical protein